jgi:hypothetical protein
MERLSISDCRKLIVRPGIEPSGDAEIVRLREMLYCLADVIADAFIDLSSIDQSTFEPPDDNLAALCAGGDTQDLDEWLNSDGGGCDVQ